MKPQGDEFRPIPGFEGRYEINFFGEVRSISRVISIGYEHRAQAHVGGMILKRKRRAPSRKANFHAWFVTLTDSKRNALGRLIQKNEPIPRLLWRAFRGELGSADIIRIVDNSGEASDLRADNLVKIDRALNRLLNRPSWCSAETALARLDAKLREQRTEWLPELVTRAKFSRLTKISRDIIHRINL